jgi:hypothetical protein
VPPPGLAPQLLAPDPAHRRKRNALPVPSGARRLACDVMRSPRRRAAHKTRSRLVRRALCLNSVQPVRRASGARAAADRAPECSFRGGMCLNCRQPPLQPMNVSSWYLRGGAGFRGSMQLWARHLKRLRLAARWTGSAGVSRPETARQSAWKVTFNLRRGGGIPLAKWDSRQGERAGRAEALLRRSVSF